ncbi:Uncharacterised protein [Acinetobacter lwoffii]|uniref:Uncharacterized protein n=1 Tax=Acinetobacter lwoffii NCTC 5866 = CIP 64.10 = NIPH 512 TaxID=981327 RepID=A0ABN0PVF2_ACILW|nr:hypothetical protein F995_02762 [Acinetobacter sp. CIP A162]ESJ94210.1 hypothetical protein P800_02284 [Acinetobacter lwoffii NCTC 5866 = CIP 64.10 = NIPH 512]GEA63872.1 hypothetical protein AL1T_11500 [Acinetobacter lwoffii]SUU33604.1 Uncharacterised protein [Acinetobacter lwoffii]VFQ36268.1 Uncharacterised protein [Acinetobacter lwoffii]
MKKMHNFKVMHLSLIKKIKYGKCYNFEKLKIINNGKIKILNRNIFPFTC